MGVPILPMGRVPVLTSAELTAVSGTGIDITELTGVLSTGSERIPDLPKWKVPVSRSYRTNTCTPGITVEGIPIPRVFGDGRTGLT